MRWTRERMLYAGENTSVYRCSHPGFGDCVVKQSRKVSDPSLIESLPGLSHPNVLFPLKVTHFSDQVIEFYPHRSSPTLRVHEGPRPAEAYALAIARALEYLHDRRIVHRDVRPNNIFVGDNVELFDFDHSVRPGVRVSAINGDDAFPPEARTEGPVDYSFDTWQTGLILQSMTYVLTAGFRIVPHRLLTSAGKVLIEKALARDPRMRYRHGGELREALESITLLSDSPISV